MWSIFAVVETFGLQLSSTWGPCYSPYRQSNRFSGNVYLYRLYRLAKQIIASFLMYEGGSSRDSFETG